MALGPPPAPARLRPLPPASRREGRSPSGAADALAWRPLRCPQALGLAWAARGTRRGERRCPRRGDWRNRVATYASASPHVTRRVVSSGQPPALAEELALPESARD
ncbi:hypothetical protein NN561_003290 [Cricetulus griseus]